MLHGCCMGQSDSNPSKRQQALADIHMIFTTYSQQPVALESPTATQARASKNQQELSAIHSNLLHEKVRQQPTPETARAGRNPQQPPHTCKNMCDPVWACVDTCGHASAPNFLISDLVTSAFMNWRLTWTLSSATHSENTCHGR